MGWRRGQAAIGTEWRVGAEQALVEKTNLRPPQLCQSLYLGLPWVEAEGQRHKGKSRSGGHRLGSKMGALCQLLHVAV